MEVFKTHSKNRNRKGKCELVTQVNRHYVTNRLLTLVPSEVTKHSNYTPYFTN